MIKDVIERLSAPEEGAMIVRAASSKDLAQAQKDMAEIGLKPIPQGYIDFLREYNGFAWNGVEFFSTDQVTDPDTEYTLMDIVTENEDFARYNEDLPDLVYLGRADDDLYVYDTKSQKYQVLDFTGRDVMDEFDTFDALFTAVVEPRI